MAKSQAQRVVFQPAAYKSMQRGINRIVQAIRPTLGPLPRVVAIERTFRNESPELLDDGGVIARRIVELADRDEDMGAMFIRQLLWNVREEAGDGTATAAVLFQSIYNQGVKYVVAGGSAMRMRHYLEKGMRVVLDELDGMTARVEGKEKLAQIAESICHDPPLAKTLGEIMDIIGEHGYLDIRPGQGREIEREYVEGLYWKSSLLSRQMITDHAKLRTELENAAILISDLEIQDPRQIVPLLDQAITANVHALMIVAEKLSEHVVSVLLAASRDPANFRAIAVQVPCATLPDRIAAMEDMAILTGGQCIVKATGQALSDARLKDLGRARRVWADLNYFGIIGGQGDPRALRRHIANLRAGFKQAQDRELRQGLQERIGRLMGGSALLWVGGVTESEIKQRQERAEQTARLLRGAMMEGVLPGGGVSLLACRPALRRKLEQATDPDERAACRILLRAMEEPTRAILGNAGYDASEVMAEIKRAGPGQGFDVRSGQMVDTAQAGILDAASALKTSVRGAISSVALALTVDVLIHHERRQLSMEP